MSQLKKKPHIFLETDSC